MYQAKIDSSNPLSPLSHGQTLSEILKVIWICLNGSLTRSLALKTLTELSTFTMLVSHAVCNKFREKHAQEIT